VHSLGVEFGHQGAAYVLQHFFIEYIFNAMLEKKISRQKPQIAILSP
jgi:hypothetical protein